MLILTTYLPSHRFHGWEGGGEGRERQLDTFIVHLKAERSRGAAEKLHTYLVRHLTGDKGGNVHRVN